MFEELLSRIGFILTKNKIPYMIIGGQAVLLYGEPRLTRDIDITIGVSTDRLNDILTILKEISLKPLPAHIESFVRETMVLPSMDAKTGIRVDLIFSFTPYETQAIERARSVSISGCSIFFASPEDVIIHKIFAGRPRDIEDARTVILKNPDIDTHYIRKWLNEFNETINGKDFLKTFEWILGTFLNN